MKHQYVTFDEGAEVLYVSPPAADVAETRNLSDLRLIDKSADGAVVGIEFVSAS